MFQLHLLQHLCWSHNGESTFLSRQVGKALQKYDLFCKGQVAFRTRCPGSRAIFEVLAKLFLDLGLWKTNKQLLDENSQILWLWKISSIFIVDLEALKVTTTQNGDSDLLPNHPNRNMAWCIFIVFLIKTLTRAIKSPDFSAITQGMCLLVSLVSFSDSRMLFCASCSSPMATITSPARISGWPGHSSSSSTKYPAWEAKKSGKLSTRHKSANTTSAAKIQGSPCLAGWKLKSSTCLLIHSQLRSTHWTSPEQSIFEISSIVAPLLWSSDKSKGGDYRLLRPLPISRKIRVTRIWERSSKSFSVSCFAVIQPGTGTCS